MNREGVAVIIPMYNSQTSIVHVLNGIENQTAKENIKHVVVVNDGSTDQSIEIIEQYSSTSELPIEVVNKINGGVSSARNAGLSYLGKYDDFTWVAFCDSDDVWYADKLEKQLSIVGETLDIDCLGGQFNDRELKINGKVVDRLVRGSVKDILIHNFPQPSTVLMKYSVYKEMGGFDENQKYAEDGNYFLRVAHNYGLFYFPELQINYGYGKRGFGGAGLSGNLKGMYEGNIKNLNDMRQLGYISGIFYCRMRLLHLLKYVRRILITKAKKNENGYCIRR